MFRHQQQRGRHEARIILDHLPGNIAREVVSDQLILNSLLCATYK